MLTITLISLVFYFLLCDGQDIVDENVAKELIVEINQKLGKASERMAFAQWAFMTNITDDNEKQMIQEAAIFNNFQKGLWKNTTRVKYANFTNYALKRQFEKISVLGIAALEEEESNQFTNISTQMEKIYSGGSVCVNNTCGLELEPDLTKIMASSRDYDILKQSWTSWRDAVGKPIRELYLDYAKLGNKAALKNGFKTLDDLWLFPWETADFKEQIKLLWDELEGFYKKLHAYVRMKLRNVYGEQMPADGTIPAHLLGNMWAQQWGNILDVVAPFPNKSSIDVTSKMKEQNYTAIRMFHLSDKFFQDLGLKGMPELFWERSMIVKPKDRKVVCHASAWDFYNAEDFRIKMCTDITMDDLVTIHHEMGHIEYYLLYADQPEIFREGANPGFHEAIGDLLALSVSTPGHLYKIGLLDELIEDEETTLNYQMQMALNKVAFLPFGYLMDLWRWGVFSGETSVEQLNRRWWELRIKYQGVTPPVERSEEDFDPGAKYHIPAGVEYIRYFVAHIIQFSFHKSLCQVAQPNVPLHKCDIDGNKDAGAKLGSMLQLGSSLPWPEQLEMITGNKKMTAAALLEYFEPLIKYLDEQTKNEIIGWEANVDNYFKESEPLDRVAELESKISRMEKGQNALNARIDTLENMVKTQQSTIETLVLTMSNNSKSIFT